MPESLPPIPPSGSQLDYLVRAVTWLTAESITHTEKLGSIMASEAENAALIERLQTSLNNVSQAITKQIDQLSEVLDEMALNKPLTAQQLTQLNSIADSLNAETSRLGADDNANRPTPPPPALP